MLRANLAVKAPLYRFCVATFFVAASVQPLGAAAQNDCKKPVYLTLDTGHMGVAPYMADVLKRHAVRVTFFGANERTQTDGTSLDAQWAPWWKARAAEGHEFASHTWDHVVWQKDLSTEDGGSFRMRPTAGERAGQTVVMSGREYCTEIRRAAERMYAMTGKPTLPLFRAPAGKTSPALLEAARQCGYAHVGWSASGFLGDEVASERMSNQALLAQSLRSIREGDILLAHLGIWSRKEVWATGVLEPLVVGLKERGFCFRTLSEHPNYSRWTQRLATPSQ